MSHYYSGIAANNPVKAKAEVNSFEQAEAFLDGEFKRKLASNVVVHQVVDGGIAVCLYATDIITYYPDGTFIADNGGFSTPTTSTRCNQFGPKGWRFFHEKGSLMGWERNYEPIEMGERMSELDGLRKPKRYPVISVDAPNNCPDCARPIKDGTCGQFCNPKNEKLTKFVGKVK